MSRYGGYLIYHPKRVMSTFGNITVYHDPIQANQDPYVWNTRFLHTYCHMSQLSPDTNHINFWISGDTYPLFSSLYCDLVFVVQDKIAWPREQTNRLARTHNMIDSKEAYLDHYQWAGRGMHRYDRRSRFTLKADPQRSFQPQDEHGRLIDIVDTLQEAGLRLMTLREKMPTHGGSRPFPIDADTAQFLYDRLSERASLHLTGDLLQPIRRSHPELSSERTGKRNFCGKVNPKSSHITRCG